MTKLFISGIDTDIGKSYACGALARTLIHAGYQLFTQKIVETGCESGVSNDLLTHAKMVGHDFNKGLKAQHCPYTFKLPASPHLAAELENAEINLDYIAEKMHDLAVQCDHLLIEGAGGLCVPLNGYHMIIDFISDNQLPVILVTSSRLGSINHTILSLELCQQRNIEVRSVIYNLYSDSPSEISVSTRSTLQLYMQKKHPDALWLELPKNGHSIDMTESQMSLLLGI